jgi:prepilin-type processing-associated H-X9-DG protein
MQHSEPHKAARPLSRAAIASLLASAIVFFWTGPSSSLDAWLARTNYHLLQIPWRFYLPTVSAVAFCILFLAITTTSIAVIQFLRKQSRYRGSYLSIMSILLLLISASLSLTVLDGGYVWEYRQRADALTSLQHIAEESRQYAAENNQHWPPHLAALMVAGVLSPSQIRYRYSSKPKLRTSPSSSDDWHSLTSSVDASTDFLYLGQDLIISPAFTAVASNIIVAVGKTNLPEIPIAIYNANTRTYDYQFTARPVAFADGHAALFPLEQLPTIFASSNTERSTLHLPPQNVQ